MVHSYWIAIPSGSFTPEYLSVDYAITPNALAWGDLAPSYVKQISYDGSTWWLYNVTTTVSAYQPTGGVMSTYQAWLHDEDNSTNRTSYDNYTVHNVTETVNVYVLTDIFTNATSSFSNIGSTTLNTILFFSYSNTYIPASSATNSWSKSGNTYSISVDLNNQWISTSHSVTANHSYSISVSVSAESGYDGVIVTSASNSSGTISSASSCSGYITHATGSNGSATETYVPSSNGSIYLYFKTDSSNISPDPETATVTIIDNGIPTPSYAWSKSGNTYSITVSDDDQWVLQQISVTANHTYSISMTVRSEASYDGIALFSGSHSSGTRVDNMASWSDCILTATSTSNGTSTTVSTSWTATSSGSIYLYFYTDGSSIYPSTGSTGSVTITDQGVQPTTVTVTLNANGGSGGTTSVSIAPGTAASNYPSITRPSKSGYTFLGYYDQQVGGTQYYDDDGDGATTFDKTSNCTFWAHWQVNIDEYYYGSASVYCTDDAVALSSTDEQKTVVIASASPSSTAGSLSVSIYKVNNSTTTTGWTLTNSNKSLNIASGKAAGTYTIIIKMSVSGAAPNYEGNEITATVTVTINATSISSYGNVTLSKTTLTQYADFPASAFTVSTSTIGDYFEYTGTVSQTITYNNGATRDGDISESWSGTSKSFTTLGDTPTSRGTVSFNTMSLVFTGEGNKSKSATTSTGYREANTLGTQHYKNTSGTTGDNITYGTPTVSIGSGIVASGGSATVTCSVENETTYYLKYTSGSYSSLQSDTSSGTAKWAITSNGNSAFTASGTSSSLSGVGTVYNSGGTVSHSNMTNNARTDTVVVTAYNVSSTSKTATAEDATTNSLGWEKPVITRTATVAMPVAGGSVTGPSYATATQTQQYTSGTVVQTIDVPNSAFTYAVSTSKTWATLTTTGDAKGTVTFTNNMTTSARDGFKVSIVATYNNRTSQTSYTQFNQAAGSQAYMDPVVTGFTYASFAASGATKTPTVTYYQDYAWNGVAGTGTRTENTGGTLAFTTTGTLPTGFSTGSNYSTTGSVTWDSRGSTIGNTQSAKSNLKVTVTMNSKTSSAYTCTSCDQGGNYVTAVAPRASSGTTHIVYSNITAADTSAAVTKRGAATFTFTSGSTSTTAPTGGTATYTRTYTLESVQNGFTAVNSSGTLTATNRGTTLGAARTSGNVTSVLTVKFVHNSTYSTGGTVTSNTMTSTVTCTQGANAVESLTLSVSPTSIVYGGTATTTVTATFTSTATDTITTGVTFTTNPTNIVSIS